VDFDPIRPRNVIANCLTEFSRVWAYNPLGASKTGMVVLDFPSHGVQR